MIKNLLRYAGHMLLASVFVATAPSIAHAADGSTSDSPGLSPASAQLVEGYDGFAAFCLTPQAAAALSDANLTLKAIAPTTLQTDPQSSQTCFDDSALTAQISLDLTAGGFDFPGGLTFTRPEDGRTLVISGMAIHFGLPSTMVGYVNGDAAQPVTLATFGVPALNIHIDPLAVPATMSADNVPLYATDSLAAAFQQAFGASPWQPGAQLFTATGHGDIDLPAVSSLVNIGNRLLDSP